MSAQFRDVACRPHERSFPLKRKYRVGVVGATGYVGQRLVALLEDHPWFELGALAAGIHSADKTYAEAVEGRWKLPVPIPANARDLRIFPSQKLHEFCEELDFAFCAVDMEKEELITLERSLALEEIPVISNNSAHRWTSDVPMIIPEVNPEHLQILEEQKKRLGTHRGFIVTKPNCSVQSFLPALTPLRDLGLEQVFVTTFQAVSGAGRKLEEWPEIQENVIPYISGEEEKTELEPLKIWGELTEEGIRMAEKPLFSGQCTRVPVQEGHLAMVLVRFRKNCDANEILRRWRNWLPYPQKIDLPSAPKPFLRYLEEDDRPQPKLDVLSRRGMGITIGNLREDAILDYKFTCLSHNTLRGAAGGSILTAELLVHDGYIIQK